MKHMRLSRVTFITTIVIIIVAAIGVGIYTFRTANAKSPQQHAQQIPIGTYFAKVRQLSTGKKPACLTRNTALDATVQADDTLPFEKSMSPALGTVIPDMPAGYTTTYLHTYTQTKATGYEIFSDKNQRSFVGDLKSFNFSIQRSNTEASWKLTSFLACTV